MTDRRKPFVTASPDGWYAVIEGRNYGPWSCREYAEAGLQVEQRRLHEHMRAALTREQWDKIGAELPAEVRVRKLGFGAAVGGDCK